MMFLLRFLLFFGVRSCEGLYVSLWSYPLSLRAFWYGAMSKVSLLDEMVVNRLSMLSGMFIYIYIHTHTPGFMKTRSLCVRVCE